MFHKKEYVYEVYKEKSFSKAAASLFISQPSLSAHIIRLEESLGLPIFDRSTSPLRLTEFGRAYISAVEEVMQIEKRIESYASDIYQLKTGRLSLGASNVFAAYVLPPIITAFKQKYPDVEIRLTEGNTAYLEELLSKNELDMVIDNNHYARELYDAELYAEENILLAMPSKDPLCREASEFAIQKEVLSSGAYASPDFPCVPLSFFSEVPFVLLSHGNDTRIRADRLCREAGFRPREVMALGQQATAYMVAATGIGAAFVSDTLAKKLPAHDALVYYKLSGNAAKRKVYFYLKKHKHRTRALEEFLRFIREGNPTEQTR